jgi:hypothetical protein
LILTLNLTSLKSNIYHTLGLFVWLFFFTDAFLAVVYVSHVEDRFFTPYL